MKLYKGKTKSILEGSVDAALLAVETYNKPNSKFKIENYILLMIIAWTRLFHAFFNKTIGDIFYYKNKVGTRYLYVDGEKKAWELNECIKHFKKLEKHTLISPSIEANLNFFIMMRNKIAHKYVEKREIESLLFGEFQSLLYNYETFLIDLFGEEYYLNEALSYSLQFSTIRGNEQITANKRALSKEMSDLKFAINKYRAKLSQEILDSQEYSIKVLLIPKISNTKVNDIAIEFYKPDKTTYEDVIHVLTKDKVQKVEAVNIDKFLPGIIVKKVNQSDSSLNFKVHEHTWLCKIFAIRPFQKNQQEYDPFNTKTKYCLYDEAHKNYIYTSKWINLVIKILNKMKKSELREYASNGAVLDITQYE